MADIGKRVPIKLVNQTPVLTGSNWVNNDTTLLNTWADLKTRNGFRGVENGQVQLGQFFEFRFRYREEIDINANTRLIYDGKRYTVHSIQKENGKKFYWIVTCQSKTFN